MSLFSFCAFISLIMACISAISASVGIVDGAVGSFSHENGSHSVIVLAVSFFAKPMQ